LKKKYIPFSCLPLIIIGLRPSSRLCLSHIMHELFATGCEETMFNIVLNMHELFDAGRDETMFAIVLNIHESFAAWGEETVFEFVLNRHELFAAGSEETIFEIVLNMHELFWRLRRRNSVRDCPKYAWTILALEAKKQCSRLSLTYMNYLALDAKIFLRLSLTLWLRRFVYNRNVVCDIIPDVMTLSSGWRHFNSNVTRLTFSFFYFKVVLYVQYLYLTSNCVI
jgi:hypothetical protein